MSFSVEVSNALQTYVISESVLDNDAYYTDLVASSRSRMGGFFSSVRAIATRCFSPPLNLTPRSPTVVSYPRTDYERIPGLNKITDLLGKT